VQLKHYKARMEEILKAMSVFKRMEEVQKEMESLTKGSLEREARKMTYIS
jgi:hypothetical protein